MSLCGGWSLVKHDADGSHGITLWCRSWLCPDCAPYRVGALKRLAMDGQPTTFLTLTVNPQHGESPSQRARELSNAFRILVKRARRKFTKGPIEYLAVFEETKKGEPHLHVLLRAPYLPQPWISSTMQELIEAPIVDIRRVGHIRNAARYVAKYVGKGPKAFADLKRYWCSPKYDLQKEQKPLASADGDSGWRVVQEPLFILYEQWRSFCHEVLWINDNEIFHPRGARWRPPWEKETGTSWQWR